jgi:periplasmic divalent cation tolerance protein
LIVSTTEKSGAAADFDVVIVLTTIGVGVDADPAALARTLVEERLAACVNILPAMTSLYRWEGRIEKDQERQLVIKTTRDRLAALEERVRHLHPYEVPEFLVLPASGGSDAYIQWVGESTRLEAK